MKTLVVAALCVLQATAWGANPEKTLENGYQLRFDHPKPEDRYRVMLQYPDGTEDLIWNPAGVEIVNGRKHEVQLGLYWYGKITDQKLSVIIPMGGNWWWLRWDMNKKRELSLIEIWGSRGDKRYLEIMDGRSIGFVYVDRLDQWATLTVHEMNGTFFLREGDTPWTGGYRVYRDNKMIIHRQFEDEDPSYIDDPQTFPYEYAGRPITAPYTLAADGTKGFPWGSEPYAPGFQAGVPPKHSANSKSPAAKPALPTSKDSQPVAMLEDRRVQIGIAAMIVAGSWLMLRLRRSANRQKKSV